MLQLVLAERVHLVRQQRPTCLWPQPAICGMAVLRQPCSGTAAACSQCLHARRLRRAANAAGAGMVTCTASLMSCALPRTCCGCMAAIGPLVICCRCVIIVWTECTCSPRASV